jgi:predicted methyltransferase
MLSFLLLLACAHTPADGPAAPAPAPAPAPSAPPAPAAAPAVDYAALVAAPDRTDADRALDEGRHPAALLAAMGVRPGDRVADLMAGGGYTTELLARAVGPTGVVYGQNNTWVLERFAAAPWAERLARPVNTNVTRLDAELEAPFGAAVGDLDLVSMVLFYHDSVWLKVDRPAMNAAIFAALKPGGRYVVVDHSARAGTGLADVETLHRIDEGVVKAEVEAAGFRLVESASFLRNPADTRDWSASPGKAAERRGTSDRFVFVFEKPVK